jgi:putative protease
LERECSEWSHLFKHAAGLGLDGLMVSSIGMLRLAKEHAALPIYGDLSLNLFNGVTAKWLQDNGLRQGTVSAEATCEQIWDLCQHTPLPLEMIIHGPLEAMVMDHHLPEAILGLEKADVDRSYGLLDTAGQIHPIAIDQYERNHVLFAKDLCLLPFLSALTSVGSYRIEGQHYAPALVGKITKAYRKELDELAAKKEAYAFSADALTALSEASPRPVGIGAFRYRISR